MTNEIDLHYIHDLEGEVFELKAEITLLYKENELLQIELSKTIDETQYDEIILKRSRNLK